MGVDAILSRLDGVRGRQGSWSAKCPAHADRTPSISIKELEDGRILIKCFAGCGAADVMQAIGLGLSDLFPERLGDFAPRRGAFTASDALRALTFESSVVAIAACDLAERKPVDLERVTVAAGRIAEALEFVHGR